MQRAAVLSDVRFSLCADYLITWQSSNAAMSWIHEWANIAALSFSLVAWAHRRAFPPIVLPDRLLPARMLTALRCMNPGLRRLLESQEHRCGVRTFVLESHELSELECRRCTDLVC